MALNRELNRWGLTREKVSLKEFTTFNIGGYCDYFFSPDSEESLKNAVSFLLKRDICLYILGAGSNLLISSDRLRGVVVDLCLEDIQIRNNLSEIYVASAVKINKLLNFCLTHSLGGIEFLSGIPASLGGAVKNNTSFRGESISQKVVGLKVLDIKRAEIYFLENKDISWQYRDSGLEGFIILGAVLSLSQTDIKEIKGKIKDNLRYRLSKQELTAKSAGCIFRNPAKEISAGKLIEDAGLKGLRKDKAVVSSKHANFILNESCAKSQDVIFLIEKIKEKVKSKFGIVLKEEIQRWGC